MRWHMTRIAFVVGAFLLLAVPLRGGAESQGSIQIASEFQTAYASGGGLQIFGFPISEPTSEGGLRVQYFERARFEYHAELAGSPYQVQLARLGVQDASTNGLLASAAFQALPTGGSDGNCVFFEETGHRLCSGFRVFWQSHGADLGDAGASTRESLALFGFPISEEFTDPSTGLTVQYFERARFEYHPELAGTANVVELSLLGQRVLEQQVSSQVVATNDGLRKPSKPPKSKQPSPTPTTTPSATATSAADTGSAMTSTGVLFGVYPGGGNGEVGFVTPPSASEIVAAVNTLRSGRPASVHLYTAWSWYDQSSLDTDIATYTGAGYAVSLTVKYSPPSGHVGDVSGFVSFVRSVVGRYGSNPNVTQFVIGNEINVVNGNPSSSDGPISGVRDATIQGVIVASQTLSSLHSSARVGTDLAVLERNVDAQFMQSLATQGGKSFTSAMSFMGLNVYPGLWPVGSGDAYVDMSTYLKNARYTLSSAGFGSDVTIDVLENGYPTTDENLQSTNLDAFVRAVCDNASTVGISGYSWFDLWDANSASSSMYDHYGLLRSDLTPKPAFGRYQQTFQSTCAATN